MSRLIVQGKLTGFFSSKTASACCIVGEMHWLFQATREIQDKSMTQTFHLEADKIPITFPLKCQGLDRFIWLAQEPGYGGGGLCIPFYMPKNATVTVSELGQRVLAKCIVFASARWAAAAMFDSTEKAETITDSI